MLRIIMPPVPGSGQRFSFLVTPLRPLRLPSLLFLILLLGFGHLGYTQSKLISPKDLEKLHKIEDGIPLKRSTRSPFLRHRFEFLSRMRNAASKPLSQAKRLPPTFVRTLHRCLDQVKDTGFVEELQDDYEEYLKPGSQVDHGEGVLILDLYFQWSAAQLRYLLEKGPEEVAAYPLPHPSCVLRLLESIKLPCKNVELATFRLDAILFLDRTGFLEALYGHGLPKLSPELFKILGQDRDGLHESLSVAASSQLDHELSRLGNQLAGRLQDLVDPPQRLGDVSQSRLRRLLNRPQDSDFSLLSLAARSHLLDPPAPGSSLERMAKALDVSPSSLSLILAGQALCFTALGFLFGALVFRRRSREILSDPSSTPPPEGPELPSPPPQDTRHLDPQRTSRPRPSSPHEQAAKNQTVASTPSLALGDTPLVPSEELAAWIAPTLEAVQPERYRDLKLLGSGGMGTVVAAFDTRLERQVAIKLPPPNLANQPDFRQRFVREARALARLSHNHIARIYDVPEVQGNQIPIMVLEYIRGSDLGQYLKEKGPPPRRNALRWIAQAAGGLHHAHSQGILHRDVKPANIMVTEGEAKLIDFGLAAIEDRLKITRSGMIMGSLAYMPPEQLRGERVGKSADVYALGVTSFELLTGRLPFELHDSRRSEVPRASEIQAGIPPTADKVLAHALSPDPARRYPEIREFIRDLVETFRFSGTHAAVG
jgi:serine/threonine protein kinase